MIAFQSWANNLVPGDTNGRQDVFVRITDPSAPRTFCVAQTNSLGCAPTIGWSGSPSLAAGSGFDVTAANVLNRRLGLLFYSRTGGSTLPFAGALLCARPPLRRTPARTSGGSPPPVHDCSGLFTIDFNAWIASGADPLLVPGQDVWAQWWSRDPAAPSKTNLSDALRFQIGP